MSGKIDVTGQTQSQPNPPIETKVEKKETQPKNINSENISTGSSTANLITYSTKDSSSTQIGTQQVSSPISSYQSQIPSQSSISQGYPSTQSQNISLSEDPSSKNNCVLFIISEYGNPQPPNGFFTYKKGEKIECKVEKEVIVENKKYICDGYEGYGSIEDGNENNISFIITTDTKIKWKWKRIEGGRNE